MKPVLRRLVALAVAAGLSAACAAQNGTTAGAGPASPPARCAAAGEWCHWDKQCCSGRCNVDTGCGG